MNGKLIAAAAIALGASAALVACILVDPPPIVTPPPLEAPQILTLSVSPPLTQVVKTTPPCTNGTDCFVVPVLVDPNATIKYRVFVDLDPTGSPTQKEAITQQVDGGALGVTSDAGPTVRLLTFSLTQSLQFDTTQCHDITFIVAYDFFPDIFWKPFPPGLGNSVTWRYEPIDNCTLYDAGVMPDAGTD